MLSENLQKLQDNGKLKEIIEPYGEYHEFEDTIELEFYNEAAVELIVGRLTNAIGEFVFGWSMVDGKYRIWEYDRDFDLSDFDPNNPE